MRAKIKDIFKQTIPTQLKVWQNFHTVLCELCLESLTGK